MEQRFGLFLALGGEGIAVAAALAVENGVELLSGVVREVEILVEPGFQTGIGGQEFFFFFLI